VDQRACTVEGVIPGLGQLLVTGVSSGFRVAKQVAVRSLVQWLLAPVEALRVVRYDGVVDLFVHAGGVDRL